MFSPRLPFCALPWVALIGCNAEPPPHPPPTPLPPVDADLVSTPSPVDLGRRCADVGEGRVCWDPQCKHGICPVSRTLPRSRALGGWRCRGMGKTRVCEARGTHGRHFRCQGEICEQKEPYFPSSAEWECLEQEGVVICRGGFGPSGLPAPERPSAYLCGPRRGHSSEQICIDFSPDRSATRSQCRFARRLEGGGRVCSDGSTPPLGRPCTRSRCSPSLRCVEGSCWPAEPRPECWVDPDCGKEQHCRLGTCRDAET